MLGCSELKKKPASFSTACMKKIAISSFECDRTLAVAKFWDYHQNKIEQNSSSKIDALIFIYSGHGVEDGIMFPDGKSYSISGIHGAFDSENLQS